MTARTGVVYRPAGSITSERALVVLVIATRRLVTLMERVTAAERSVAADPTPEYAALEARVSESLRTSAGLVAHEVEDGDGLAALTAARDAHSAALERWAAAVLPKAGATRVVDGFTATFPLRRLSLAAMQIADAADAAGHDQVRTRAVGEAAVKSGSAILRCALQRAFGALPQRGEGRARTRTRGPRGEDDVGRARLLGRARRAVGAAIERARHGCDRPPGARRCTGGLRDRGCADRDRRRGRHVALDRVAVRGVPRRLHAGRGELRRRAGRVHRVRRRAVRHPRARGLAHRTRACAGHRDRRRHQRRGRCAALAPRCRGVARRSFAELLPRRDGASVARARCLPARRDR